MRPSRPRWEDRLIRPIVRAKDGSTRGRIPWRRFSWWRFARKCWKGTVPEQIALSFAEVLRRLRTEAQLTQEDLAEIAGLSPRSVSDLERGVNRTARKATAELLANALKLADPVRALFVAAARGLGPAADVIGAKQGRSTEEFTAKVSRNLPREVPGFSGRRVELARMLEVISPSGGLGADKSAIDKSDRPAEIIAISGTAGVGKTALAIRFARQVAQRYPDGQLYVNLRGFDPSGSAISPDDALRYLLDALAVPPQRMPADLATRGALFRGMVDGKRVLIVLDNAHDAEQVRPLLPGSPGSLVLVTSRSQLTGLIAADAATPLSLDVLTADEAHELVGRRLGPEVVAAEPQATAELITLCARLPLALGVAAGRAATRPGLSLAALADELRDTRNRLAALEVGDAATDVRAVLSWSYEQLSEPAARTFRLLGLHPGPDVSVAAAASLAGVSCAQVTMALRELTRMHVVAEPRPGRFAFHDLLRAYAVQQAEATDSQPDQQAAVRRCLAFYLHSAHAAALQINQVRKPLDLPPVEPGSMPEGFAGQGQPMAWFDAESSVLFRLFNQAVSNHDDESAWQIAWTLSPFLYRHNRWHECIGVQRLSLQAAQRLGGLVGLGHAYCELGRGLVNIGDFAGAEPQLAEALRIFGELGDRANEATAHHGFGALFEQQGQYAQSLSHAREALRIVREIGPASTVARLENVIGWLYGHLGQFDEALACCQKALKFQSEIGYRVGEADTWDSLGYIHNGRREYRQAAVAYGQAVELYHEIGDRFHEAGAHIGLGDALLRVGDQDAARKGWRQALAILESIPHRDAERARSRLNRLDLGEPLAEESRAGQQAE
jgi:tetratricopeptide (TPR) repeat protein/transcriptional regulator with XRE-family HTH domain